MVIILGGMLGSVVEVRKGIGTTLSHVCAILLALPIILGVWSKTLVATMAALLLLLL